MILLRVTTPCLVVVLSLAALRSSAAEPSADTNAVWLAEHYTKYEHRIPMRDGIRLFTRVYVPKDDSQAWPMLLTRPPYAFKPYGVDNYNDPTGSARASTRLNRRLAEVHLFGLPQFLNRVLLCVCPR